MRRADPFLDVVVIGGGINGAGVTQAVLLVTHCAEVDERSSASIDCVVSGNCGNIYANSLSKEVGYAC